MHSRHIKLILQNVSIIARDRTSPGNNVYFEAVWCMMSEKNVRTQQLLAVTWVKFLSNI